MEPQTLADRRWWKKNKEDLVEAIFAEVFRIDRNTIDRQQLVLEAAALYGELGPWPQYYGITRLLPSSRRISHNVIANAVDTLVSEVTQSVPRPMAVTIGGSFDERQRAKKNNRYFEAKFDECYVHNLARQAVRDSILSGLGYLRPYRENPAEPENDSVKIERIHPALILLDDRNCIDVKPRQIYIRRFIDRSYLMEIFPKKKQEIENAAPPTHRFFFSFDTEADVVEVVEAYSLASVSGRNDGRHVGAINTDDGILWDVPYPRTRFPGAFITPVSPQTGFWADPLVRRAAPAQYELNKLLRRVQESMHLHAVPRVFIQRQSGVIESHMQNDIGIIVQYDGNIPPIFLTPASMSSDVYNHILQLEMWIYKELGVSEFSATSRKPPGIESGAALRSLSDVQSRRFINLQRAFEQLVVDLAEEIIYLEDQIAEDYPEHEVVVGGKRGSSSTKWKDISLSMDKMRVRVFPASSLPTQPAGKLQALEDMVRNQVITPEIFFQLADMPDFEGIRDLQMAPRELLEEQFENMLAGGEFLPPEPYMDLTMGRQLAAIMLQRAELDGATDENLDKLRDWIESSLDLERRIAMTAMPPGPVQSPPSPVGTGPNGQEIISNE